MKKATKYILGVLGIVLILIFSFKIEKLDEYKASKTVKVFNAAEYAEDVWQNKMPAVVAKAPNLISLIDMLETDKEKAFEDYGNKLGISSTWYFMANGEGVIDSLGEESLLVDIGNGHTIQLATSFIFGNAVRDASGVVNINDFINMTDFNNFSVALNKLVKDKVAGELKRSARAGMKLKFTGAFEINQDNTDVNQIRIIPISVNFINE